MPRLTHLRNPANAALALIVLVTITSQTSLIWRHAVADFDTDTHVGRAVSGEACGANWIVKPMGDSAHPLGNALLQRWACQFHQSDLLTPAQGWFLLLSVAVAVTAALLTAFAHISGGGTAAATIAIAYLGLSPVLRALSHRAEEDWVGLTLFLGTTMCILAFHGARTSPWAWLVAVGVSTLVLGVWHTQYLLVFAIGLVPWGVVGMLRPSLVGTTRPRALLLGAAMLPTAGVLGALFRSGYVYRADYHEMFMSIFNEEYWEGVGGIWQWCLNYAAYSSRWLTGWVSNEDMAEALLPPPATTPFALVGLATLALLVLLVVITRSSLLMAITFGCLTLPFLYEPFNAERWGPTAAILALTLASGAYLRPWVRETADGSAHPGKASASEPPPAGAETGVPSSSR